MISWLPNASRHLFARINSHESCSTATVRSKGWASDGHDYFHKPVKAALQTYSEIQVIISMLALSSDRV